MSPNKTALANTSLKNKSLWLERTLAILALLNFGLVLFDLSYIPWRNLYFRYLNPVTKIYDPIKGIEPHRETAQYLATVKLTLFSWLAKLAR
jgi:hypothetical protein